MISTLALCLWLIGFYLVLKYRVHIHVNITSTARTSFPVTNRAMGHTRNRDSVCSTCLGCLQAGGKKQEPATDGSESGLVRVPQSRPPLTGSAALPFSSEIQSALVNLGCKKDKARAIVTRVCSQPGSFDELLRRAIQEAA